ncbi:hypothetical protein M407DRAFT_17754 [Tulasnella calospora MUT 4182]|uniref:NAD(P)-binding protein n=1 Tax=Tulasnella calospora MUT 4182 TaxID=1051891 RepID=A0A0C3MII6_9AGAM|nr:hypothetical protein M407DRAFT_17754 [Tulasnella calospora MUT 4182]
MGVIQSARRFITQTYPPTSKFEPQRDIPDLAGKVIIVTGGNTGIGRETIKALLLKNAKVYMASRSRPKAEAAINDLKQQTGKEALFLELDLANLDKVRKAADEFMRKEPVLHILFNSGGVMFPPVEQLTDDGYDLQFGTNCLGHAHFTLSLMPALIDGAKASPDGKARVVNTSSFVVYYNSQPLIKWNTLRDDPARTALGTRSLYAQSKYGVVGFSNELARRYAEHGIVSNAANPGSIRTDLQRHLPSFARTIIYTLFSKPAPMGALTQLYAATSPETANATGKWFVPWAREWPHSDQTRDPEVESKLWDWIQEQRKGH